ncbi:MAG: 23S rRNA (guanosine(2251)-2'-O)-methyltransferase RlmB [Actinomycetota bacterium]|nr:23S rRNA (guanosine(2251)-2'-O)-methyltransferase RlmB [Actinomycetota bacterium]
MAGNSQRRGAMRKGAKKKGAGVGSGGQRKASLEGKGPTPKATERAHHPAAKKARRIAKDAPRTRASSKAASKTASKATGDVVIGRNSVVEALRARIPATALYLQVRADPDDRWRESISLAREQGIPIFEGSRTDLDALAHLGLHQGLVLAVPEYEYAHLDDIATGNLLVMLDGITDTHNVGAIARSAAAFGAAGLVLPSRRSAGITASAWKASAGALSRLPVARVTNLRVALEELHTEGWMSIGLDADAELSFADIDQDVITGKVVIVIGSEGEGISRLLAQTCDFLVRIPMVHEQESLNASVAAGIALNSVFSRR